MPKGYPDWGVVKNSVGVYSDDNAELAVRLGSPYRISRTGRVLVATNFLNYFRDWTYVLSSQYTANAYLLDGLFTQGCLRVFILSNTLSTWQLVKSLPLVYNSIYGFELCLREASVTQPYINLTITWISGTITRFFELEIRTFTNEIWYRDNTGTLVKLQDLPVINTVANQWTTIKMLVDPDNGQYKELQINGVNLLTVFPVVFTQSSPTSSQRIAFGATFKPRVSSAMDMRIATAVITFDEESI